MRYEIVLSPEALEDFRGLKASLRAMVRDALEQHLRHDPARISSSGFVWGTCVCSTMYREARLKY
jgi:hypothetical protein